MDLNHVDHVLLMLKKLRFCYCDSAKKHHTTQKSNIFKSNSRRLPTTQIKSKSSVFTRRSHTLHNSFSHYSYTCESSASDSLSSSIYSMN